MLFVCGLFCCCLFVCLFVCLFLLLLLGAMVVYCRTRNIFGIYQPTRSKLAFPN